MTRLWQTKGTIVANVLDAKEKVFIFKFENEKDRSKIIDGQSWHFDKFIWCFNEPNGEGKLTETPLYHVPLWTRVYDLPIKGRTNEANLRHLGAQLGQFVSSEDSSSPEIDRAVRLRIVHDVRKPLKKYVGVRMAKGNLIEFKVKYERLPIFCYDCGRLGHGEKDCEEGPYEEGELQFGEELRASPWKPVKTVADTSKGRGRSLSAEMENEHQRREEEAVQHLIDKL
ncbi:uncharacterized protein LOC141620475 [Silene latifolia]|uniref:uncharacterized protein LOC141620475 n=1 Tax=Silene latifolia TaxID=37657 RepID=UPI003D76F5AC